MLHYKMYTYKKDNLYNNYYHIYDTCVHRCFIVYLTDTEQTIIKLCFSPLF